MYIITHKLFDVPQLDSYTPLEVGAVLRNSDYGYLKDDSGDNISSKNPNYCELTGLYWIWKNENVDFVGISHYRRYFSRWILDADSRYYYSMSRMVDYLNDYDIILPKSFFWVKHNVGTGYYEAGQGLRKDLDAVREIINKRFPDYLSSFDNVIMSHKASYCNMMVSKKTLFDEYCMWLFDILFELEKNIDLSNYTVAEARVFGYLSEILLNVWVKKNQLKVKFLPVAVDKPITKKRKPLYMVEKIPIIGLLSKIVLCADIKDVQHI
jgi:hypothetical protein